MVEDNIRIITRLTSNVNLSLRDNFVFLFLTVHYRIYFFRPLKNDMALALFKKKISISYVKGHWQLNTSLDSLSIQVRAITWQYTGFLYLSLYLLIILV